LNQKFKLGY